MYLINEDAFFIFDMRHFYFYIPIDCNISVVGFFTNYNRHFRVTISIMNCELQNCQPIRYFFILRFLIPFAKFNIFKTARLSIASFWDSSYLLQQLQNYQGKVMFHFEIPQVICFIFKIPHIIRELQHLQDCQAKVLVHLEISHIICFILRFLTSFENYRNFKTACQATVVVYFEILHIICFILRFLILFVNCNNFKTLKLRHFHFEILHNIW